MRWPRGLQVEESAQKRAQRDTRPYGHGGQGPRKTTPGGGVSDNVRRPWARRTKEAVEEDRRDAERLDVAQQREQHAGQARAPPPTMPEGEQARVLSDAAVHRSRGPKKGGVVAQRGAATEEALTREFAEDLHSRGEERKRHVGVKAAHANSYSSSRGTEIEGWRPQKRDSACRHACEIPEKRSPESGPEPWGAGELEEVEKRQNALHLFQQKFRVCV